MRLVSSNGSLGSGGDNPPRTAGYVSQQRPPLRLPTRHASYRIVKRALDETVALAILPLVFVLGTVIAFLIKISSPGPVFFRHRRVGAGEHPFSVWKFRTMTPGSDELLNSYLDTHPEAQREWSRYQKLRCDPRVTAFGRFLRKTNLDELPQILNVITGDMSMVGPRPIVEEELKRYGAGRSLYASAKPGITGLWQVSGRSSLPYDRRVALDIEYVSTWSLAGDFKVLVRTLGAIFSGRGAH